MFYFVWLGVLMCNFLLTNILKWRRIFAFDKGIL